MAVRVCNVETAFPLCHMPDVVLGVSQHDQSENVIVTVQSTAVHIYNVDDQRCVLSWAVAPSTTLTHHTVQHPTSKIYFTVDNYKLLRSWKDGVDKIENGPSKSYRSRIHAVHVHPKVDGAVLLFVDGSAVQTDGELITSRPMCAAPKEIDSNCNPVFSTLVQVGANKNELYLIAVLKADNQAPNVNTYIVQLYEIDTQTSALGTRLKTQYTVAAEDVIMSVAYEEKNCSLCILCKNGALCVYQLPFNHPASQESQHAILTPFLIRHLAIYMFASKDTFERERKSAKDKTVAPRIAMHAFDGAYLAIVGEARDRNYLMTIWDLQFGTLQAKSEIREAQAEIKSSDRTRSETCQLIRSGGLANGAFVSTFGRVVDVCPVYCAPFSLAAAMSKMASSVSVLTLEDVHSHTVPPVVSAQVDLAQLIKKNGDPIEQWSQRLSEADAMGREVVKQLCDPKVTGNEALFSSAFNHYYAHLKSGTKNVQKTLPDHVVHVIVERCITKERLALWPEDVLKIVLKDGYIPASMKSALLNTIIEKDSLVLLDLALQHVRDVAEGNVIKALQYLITSVDHKILHKYLGDQVLNKASAPQKEERLADESAGLEHFMSSIFAISRNDILLMGALRDLHLNEVMVLYCIDLLVRHMVVLQQLRGWLVRYMAAGDNHIRKHFHPTPVPSFKQVLDWIASVLDAHMARLLLVPDARQMLVGLKELISRQALLCESMQDFRAYVSVLNSGVSLPTVNNAGPYSVEVIKL